MSENSLFAILLRSPWWISAAIAAAIAVLVTAMVREEWRIYGLFTSLPFAVIAAIALWRRLKSPSGRRVASTLEAVRAMSWAEFSEALEQGFRRDGYDVSRLSGAAADFEISKAGRRAVVSGKRWKVARGGVEPLRELAGAKDARDAHECVYVVAGELTDHAQRFAVEKRIRLIAGPELARLLPDAGRARRA
ncbi:hypothetical protein BURK1_03364 [Burkholderiales bacterium]|nr:hypothetical protein BURK1_03364 [Burkholderiales bacterium]